MGNKTIEITEDHYTYIQAKMCTDTVDRYIFFLVQQKVRQEFLAKQVNKSLYTSGPIDYWDFCHHIKNVGKVITSFISSNPTVEYTYGSVWSCIMDKLHWGWSVCPSVDTDLRSPDVYIYLDLNIESFRADVLFKSDNNGTVNLIVDSCWDEKQKVKEIPNEQGFDWVKTFP